MKKLILLLSTVLLINPSTMAKAPLPGLITEATVEKIMCGDKLEIKDHMARMGFIIRSLREMVSDIIGGNKSDEMAAIIMVDIQVLRTHLTAVMPKTPLKIKNIDPENIQSNKVLYQRYLTRMIGYTLDIESELLKKPESPLQEQDQRVRLANLIIDLDETVNEAHKLFRF